MAALAAVFDVDTLNVLAADTVVTGPPFPLICVFTVTMPMAANNSVNLLVHRLMEIPFVTRLVICDVVRCGTVPGGLPLGRQAPYTTGLSRRDRRFFEGNS